MEFVIGEHERGSDPPRAALEPISREEFDQRFGELPTDQQN